MVECGLIIQRSGQRILVDFCKYCNEILASLNMAYILTAFLEQHKKLM
jgi:hypothetical protein